MSINNIFIFSKYISIENINWVGLDYSNFYLQSEFCNFLSWVALINSKSKVDINVIDDSPNILGEYTWSILFKEYKNLPEWFVVKYEDRNLDVFNLYCMSSLSESFFDKRDYLICNDLLRLRKLSKSFIKRHADKFNLNVLIMNQQVPMSIIRKNIDCIDLKLLSKTQKLSKEFIREYAHGLNWFYIFNRLQYDEDFIKEHKLYVMRDVISSKSLSDKWNEDE